MTEPRFPEPGEDDGGAEESEEVEAARGARRVLVVGGGRGGVGKSLVAQSLAVYFAQLGKSVKLVDCDPTGANIHAQLGLRAASADIELDGEPRASLEKVLFETSVPGLSFMPGAHDTIDPPIALCAGRKARWLARLRAIPADWIVIDAGPGHAHLVVDLMAAADVAVCVTAPEPPAIEATYRFLRAAFRRRLRRALMRDRFRLSLVDRAMREIGRLPGPIELIRELAKMDRNLADLAWVEAHRFRPYLIVNQTRLRADAELGTSMSELAGRHYGVPLEELGHVEYDDAVWLAVRRRKPLLVDSPTSKAARNIERIARRIVAVTATPTTVKLAGPMPLETPDHYSVLGIGRASNEEEVRRAYKRQHAIYAADGLATSSLLDEAGLAAAQAQLDEAHDTLLDPVRRQAYDLSTFPEDPSPAAPAEAARPALAAEQLMLQSELAREIGPDTEFTGALLRKVRESQGIELVEISSRTKISRAHLSAIEEETWATLPAIVYVRGFVSEYAKYLRLDPAQVQRSYLRRMREKTTP